MNTYKKFKIGDRVLAINGNVVYANQQQAEICTEFTISAFPAQITKDLNYTNYVRGITDKLEMVACFPCDIRKVSNKTIDKILYPVSGKFGAKLGRENIGEKPTNMKIFDCKVPMSSDNAYEKSTAVYWGTGNELRVEYTKDLSYIHFYRKGEK